MRNVECYDLYYGSDSTNLIQLDKFPDTCPLCHYSLNPEEVGSYRTGEYRVEVIFKCTRHECGLLFISYYDIKRVGTGRGIRESWILRGSLPKSFKKEQIEPQITEISLEFEEIYNEAKRAEELNLFHVAGMGYRKSLEFLIKDFLINHEKCNRQEIEDKFLGKCINEHIENTEIKELAKRAAWLGNDESHFVRKWEDKSIEDLKMLIELVIVWVRQVVLTKKMIDSMPEK